MPQFPAMQGFDVSEGLLARAAQSAAMPDRKQSPMQGFLAAKAAKKEEELKQAQFAEEQRQFGVTSDRADKQFNLTTEQFKNTIANQKLLAEQRLIDNKLKQSQEGRDAAMHTAKLEKIEAETAAMGVKQTKKVDAQNFVYTDENGETKTAVIDVNSDKGKAEFNQLKSQYPSLQTESKQRSVVGEVPTTATAQQKLTDGLSNTANVTENIVSMIDFITENPKANTWTAAVGNVYKNIAYETGTILKEAGWSFEVDGEKVTNAKDVIDSESVHTSLKEVGVTNAVMRSMIISLAFSMATSEQGKNSISDKDIVKMIQKLGVDNSDPESIIRVLKGEGSRQIEKLLTQYEANNRETEGSLFDTLNNRKERFNSPFTYVNPKTPEQFNSNINMYFNTFKRKHPKDVEFLFEQINKSAGSLQGEGSVEEKIWKIITENNYFNLDINN